MALTRYPEGSMRELIKIALPLMLSSLSITFMIFVDRLLLAHYSTQSLNAATSAMTLGWTFLFGWSVLASIAEVFVAQYNGAGQTQKLGEPVWQMIWLGIGSTLFFLPFAVWGSAYIYGEGYELEHSYLSWMLIFGPTFPIYGALCGFFVGQGKTSLVTITAIVANLVNACFDVVLIFGIDGYLEPLGVEGAAIATSGSSTFQVLILAGVFLNRRNRELHGTSKYQLDFTLLWQCVKVGLPNAVFVTVEILGFALYYYMMTLVGERYITIAGISQSLLILFYFFVEGVSKAASTITGNLIGAQRTHLIPRVILTGTQFHLCVFAFLVLLFFFYSEEVMMQFLPTADEATFAGLRDSLKMSLFFMCLYLLFEGLRLLVMGVLTAAGDTFFLLIAGSLAVWGLLVIPIYLLIVQAHWPVEVATAVCVFYSAVTFLLYLWRFRKGNWQAISITA